MYRDFSQQSKQNLLNLVSEVENEKLCDFTDWIGDRWYDFESWIGKLNIKNYLNNTNAYHKKVIDKNNTTKKNIETIFSNVNAIDKSYASIFKNQYTLLKQWDSYIAELNDIVTPSNGHFNSAYIGKTLKSSLDKIRSQETTCVRDTMLQNINGELIFDEEKIIEYLKKSPGQMTDAEQAAVIDVISQLKDSVAIYDSLAKIGTDELGADMINYVAWISDSETYKSFSAVSAHYNDLYVNILNAMSDISEDEATFAGSLITVGLGASALSIVGVETYENLKDIFGSSSIKSYIAKYKSEHSEQYFAKLEASEQESLESSGKFKSLSDAIEDKLKDKGINDEEKETKYYDKDGNEIDEKDAPDFYKKKLTLLEKKKTASASASIYEGQFDIGEDGSLSVTVGKAEAHASFAGGFYVLDANGNKKFSPGVNAEVGASVTAFEVEWDQQWLGDENFGLNSNVDVTAGKVSTKANVGAQVFGEDGKLDVQLGASASAEAIGGEVEGKVGVNVLGGEVGVKGSVNYGIGAHADVGYRDGVIKCDVGLSVGLGVSVGIELDVGGMVNTVADAASSAWDGLKKGWNSIWH